MLWILKFRLVRQIFIKHFLKNIIRTVFLLAIHPSQLVNRIFLPLVAFQHFFFFRALHHLYLPI